MVLTHECSGCTRRYCDRSNSAVLLRMCPGVLEPQCPCCQHLKRSMLKGDLLLGRNQLLWGERVKKKKESCFQLNSQVMHCTDDLLVIMLRVPHSLALPSALHKASSSLELHRAYGVVVSTDPSSTEEEVLFSEFLLCLQQLIRVPM